MSTERLAAAGRAYEAANLAREAALDELADAMRQAQEAGVSVVEMARLGHVSRPTTYRLLKRGG